MIRQLKTFVFISIICIFTYVFTHEHEQLEQLVTDSCRYYEEIVVYLSQEYHQEFWHMIRDSIVVEKNIYELVRDLSDQSITTIQRRYTIEYMKFYIQFLKFFAQHHNELKNAPQELITLGRNLGMIHKNIRAIVDDDHVCADCVIQILSNFIIKIDKTYIV